MSALLGYLLMSICLACAWSPEDQAPEKTGITMTDVRVNSTSISFQISCKPECPESWRIEVDCYTEGDQQVTQCQISNDKKNVTCSGLRPSSDYTIRIMIYVNPTSSQPGMLYHHIKTAEAERCKRPDKRSPYTFIENRDFYDVWEAVTVRCNSDGYRPQPETIRCQQNSDRDDWDQSPRCVERCKGPDKGIPYTFMPDRDFYDVQEVVMVRCNRDGYRPQPERIQCQQKSDRDDWTSSPQCVAQCKRPEIRNVELFSKYKEYYDRYDEVTVTCKAGYYPSSNPMRCELLRTTPEWTPTVTCRAPQAPRILKVPRMNETTMKWALSASLGIITGFQMNISAWRDYDPSFVVHPESRWFPANVTECKIPLQYGTNYTITLRAFTAAGAGLVVSEDIETEIGDPPHHMERTISGRTLQLRPVHNPHGPISSYEIIVFSEQEENLTSDCLRFINIVYNSSRSPSPYTAAFLPAEDLTAPRTFTLGDNKYYNSFHNAPLLPGHNYTVYIRVTSRWRKMNKSSCSFAGFLKAPESASSNGWITVGSVATVKLLLFLILVVICCCSSRKSSHSPDIPLKARAGLGT